MKRKFALLTTLLALIALAELSEAAQLDGASPLQLLFRVLVPISWDTIGALTVIQFVYVWNFYL